MCKPQRPQLTLHFYTALSSYVICHWHKMRGDQVHPPYLFRKVGTVPYKPCKQRLIWVWVKGILKELCTQYFVLLFKKILRHCIQYLLPTNVQHVVTTTTATLGTQALCQVVLWFHTQMCYHNILVTCLGLCLHILLYICLQQASWSNSVLVLVLLLTLEHWYK